MKKIMYFLILITMLIVAAFVASAHENQPEKVRVFIEFKGNPDAGMVANAGGKVLHSYTIIPNVLAVEVPERALKGILNNPNVVSVEYDAIVSIVGKPGGKPEKPEKPGKPTKQTIPWGIDRIGAYPATNTGQGVKVCVVDTGIDKNHPDLAEDIVGKNFVIIRRILDPNKWDDDNGHGTHVAGTIAAINNSFGVVGVAPEVSLIAAKVLDRRGSGYMSDVIAGIQFCVEKDADIISMSLGGGGYSSVMDTLLNTTYYDNGTLLIASAGNSNSTVGYPAAYDSVIAVSATDENDNKAYFSNWGPEIELAAPGVNILSTWKNGGYNTISGTSMSTPHVSGVAALAMQMNSTKTNVEIRTWLRETADNLTTPSPNIWYGYGLVDAKLET